MGTPTRTVRPFVMALITAILASLALVAVGTAPAQAAEKGTVRGQVLAKGDVKVTMRWFDSDWNFINERKVSGDIYSLTLAPGTYYLQFVDTRPAYDVNKYAPTDVKVTVRKNKTTQKNVRLKPGAAITGTVRAGGKAAGGAKVVAANANEQSFSVKANSKGQFAIGGLPDGSYSVFTYERTKHWVDKSTYVAKLHSGDRRNIGITLRKKAGSLLVDLIAGGKKINKSVFVTAVSKSSGQFWTVKAKHGEATFKGLYPGKYRMVAPGVGAYLPQTSSIKGAKVRAGRADLASSFTWTKRGASVSGSVADGVYPDTALGDVDVILFDSSGKKIGQGSTDDDGIFRVVGPIPTQKGVTLKIQPGGNNPPYLNGAYYCKFGSDQLDGLNLTQGQELQVGQLLLPQLPTADQDNKSNCGPDHTAPRAH